MSGPGASADPEQGRGEAAIPYPRVAGLGAALLCAAVALFQSALALGLPLGEATFGGVAPTEDGVLSPGFRVIAAISGTFLILVAGTFLARAGVVHLRLLSDRFVYWTTWSIVGLLILNTVGNLAAPHPIERWVMGSITLSLVVLGSLIALRGPGPSRSKHRRAEG